jgi:hypothetical protein
MTTTRHLWTLLLLGALPCAQAGRPLSTDDAATADAGTCHVETWHERAGSERALVLAPACGLVPGVELDLDTTWPTPHDVVRQEAGLAVKLVPASWKFDTGAGELNFGLKFSGAWLRPVGAKWQGSQVSVLGLASLQATARVALHVNVGVTRDRSSGTRATVLNGALVWTPREPLLLFVEAQGNNKKDVFGGTVATAGARWWLVKDRLGLDFTAGRESGVGGGTGGSAGGGAGGTKRYSVGLGWYGIGS